MMDKERTHDECEKENEYKESIKYFMNEMTQQEFENLFTNKIEIKPYPFNMIRRLKNDR